jgi:hypothetical protein
MEPDPSRSPRGLRPIDVLVAAAVLAVATALALPWIERSREHSRRNQCASNLRMLGVFRGRQASPDRRTGEGARWHPSKSLVILGHRSTGSGRPHDAAGVGRRFSG